MFGGEGLIIYPIVGIGGGGLNITISEKGSYDFHEIMNNPKRGIELSNGGFITSLSLGTDYLLSFSTDEENKGGLMLLSKMWIYPTYVKMEQLNIC